MRINDFRKYELPEILENGAVLMDIDALEIYRDPDDKRKKLVKDPRSYQDESGMWHIKPIALNECSMIIVCPFCGEIHFHSISDGHRWSHCKDGKATESYEPEEAGYVLEYE